MALRELAVHVHPSPRRGTTGAILEGHTDPTWPDGIAAHEGHQCDAWSEAGRRRCPKTAAVQLLVPWGDHPILLCGGHYGVHRRGKPVLLPERGT